MTLIMPADNSGRQLERDEFVDMAAKQIAGMVFDLWLEHVNKSEKPATNLQENKDEVV